MAVLSSRFLWALLKTAFTVLLLAAGYLALATSLPLREAQSEERPFRLVEGLYEIQQPLEASASPFIQLREGRVHFSGEKGAHASLLRRLLPEDWAALFMTEQLEEITVKDGLLVVRPDKMAPASGETKTAISDAARYLSVALSKSRLSRIHLDNCRLRLILTKGQPVELVVKSATFAVDVDDGAIEGEGRFEILGRQAAFEVSSTLSSVKENSNSYRVALSLEHDEIAARFDGIASMAEGGWLQGAFNSRFVDVTLLEQLLGIMPPGLKAELAGAEQAEQSDRERIEKAAPTSFSLSGALDWRGQAGKLSGLSLAIGDSKATGTLGLKYAEGRGQISGSLAFDDLTLLGKDNEVVAGGKAGALSPGLFKDEALDSVIGGFLSRLYPLVEGYEADLRFSAERLKLGPFALTDAGFSLFQKDGEVIVDLAETAVFEGNASGHMKINTKFPKPRWHINLNFREIAPEVFSEAIGVTPLLSGKGHLQLNLTSFGDKSSEMYQNMKGALSYQSTSGGQLALDLASLNQTAADRPLTVFRALVAGETDYESLAGEGHFKNGALVADFFEITTPRLHYTGLGRLSLSDALHDWHIASWAAVKKPPRKAPEGADQRAAMAAHKLIMCSSISGSWAAPRVEKHSAEELALLRRDCRARYKAKPERSKYDYNAPLDKAG